MKTRSALVVGLMVLAIPLAAMSGCAIGNTQTGAQKQTKQAKQAKKTKKTEKASAGHAVSDETRSEILRDAQEAVRLLELVKEDTASLNAFLADPLRAQTAAQIIADSRAGRVKIRRLTNPKLSLKNSIKDIAGVLLTFEDNGYFVDKKTGRQLTRPTGASEERVLAMRKIDGKWKVYSILGKTKPPTQSPPAKKN